MREWLRHVCRFSAAPVPLCKRSQPLQFVDDAKLDRDTRAAYRWIVLVRSGPSKAPWPFEIEFSFLKPQLRVWDTTAVASCEPIPQLQDNPLSPRKQVDWLFAVPLGRPPARTMRVADVSAQPEQPAGFMRETFPPPAPPPTDPHAERRKALDADGAREGEQNKNNNGAGTSASSTSVHI